MVEFVLFSALMVNGFDQTARPAAWTIHLDEPGALVSPTMYGIFFEEINCAGEGGLYAERIRNGSFEQGLAYWNVLSGAVSTIEGSARIELARGNGSAVIENKGYWGIAAKRGERLRFRFAAMCEEQSASDLRVDLVDDRGVSLCSHTFSVKGTEWNAAKADLVPSQECANAKLRITCKGQGVLLVDQVSLMPADTFKHRENGMRLDLAQMLFELNPSFMRFPGGCWVEGDTMGTAYRWKQTLGKTGTRRVVQNLWGYVCENGLGFHEYLQFCEDIGAEPLFVINCGMSHHGVVPVDQMDEYVQDALDAIDYANGDATTRWGAERAKAGHPKPFGLKFMEIGNENGGPEYEKRYALFYRAIKARYPNITLIANVWGGHPKDTPVEMLDEHYYSDPGFFFANADRYDRYDRRGPKVYVGEYAVTQGCGQGNLIAAIAEAAFMTGLERNSDVVRMASYAPLFANLHHKTWNPDLICFDSSRCFGTPSYYVQKMFSKNRPDVNLNSSMSGAPTVTEPFPAGGIGIGSWNTQAEFKQIRVETADGQLAYDSESGAPLAWESGDWTVANGVYRQTGSHTPSREFLQGGWKAFSLRLKARKLSGAEGFLITVGRQDSNNYVWINLGGWGNRLHGIEWCVNGAKKLVGEQIPGSIDAGVWHDVRIDYSPDRIACFLDGKVLLSAAAPTTKTVFFSAGKLQSTGEVVLKLVNGSARSQRVDLRLVGGRPKAYAATLETLTSQNPFDENSLESPTRVAPQSRKLGRLPTVFSVDLVPYSLTVLRMKPVDDRKGAKE